MAKAYSSQIPHRHKALFVGQPEIEKADEVLDWAFRTMGGQATDADTVVVREMRAIASDPEAWKACGLPSGKREGALAACTEWLDEIGAGLGVHQERG